VSRQSNPLIAKQACFCRAALAPLEFFRETGGLLLVSANHDTVMAYDGKDRCALIAACYGESGVFRKIFSEIRGQ